MVEVPDDGVEATSCQRPHVQDCAYPGAPTPYGAFAPQRATVPVEGSHSNQGGDLPAVRGAQFRQVRQKGKGEQLPHAGDGAQEVVLLLPYRTLAKGSPQTLVQVSYLPLQPRNVGLNAGTDGDGGGCAQTILL